MKDAMGVIIIHGGNSFLGGCKHVCISLLEGTNNRQKYDSTEVRQSFLQSMVRDLLF